MEELLKIAYRNFMDTECEENTKCVEIINKSWSEAEKALDKLREILNENLFDEIYELITCGNSNVQEAAFICGFSYCAKFMTNGKIDFLSDGLKAGGAE